MQKSELEACLAKRPGKAEIGSIMNDSEAFQLASDWLDVFKQAGWTISQNRVLTFLIGGAPWTGMQINVHGTINDDGTNPQFDSATPSGHFIECIMGKLYFPKNAVTIPTKELAPDLVTVHVGPIARD